MHLNRFIASFNGPCSTTTKLAVAAIFATDDGIVLEMAKHEAHGALRYLNCSFVSCFPNEDERLFIMPPRTWYLQVVSIRNMRTEEDYRPLIAVLSKMDEALSGQLVTKVPSECVEKMNVWMELSLQNEVEAYQQYPPYIVESFRKWMHQKTSVVVQSASISRTCCQGFEIWIKSEENEDEFNLLDIDKMNKMFHRLSNILWGGVGAVDGLYLEKLLEGIQSVNKLKYSKLNKIQMMHTQSKCADPEFMKYQQLFRANGWRMDRNAWSLTVSR